LIQINAEYKFSKKKQKKSKTKPNSMIDALKEKNAPVCVFSEYAQAQSSNRP
jgi:hypothetical protein